MILSQDAGKAWLRGGWRNEPNAADIGKNIGMREDENGEVWYEKTRTAMEGVEAGLGAL
jgi:hypothetical protein